MERNFKTLSEALYADSTYLTELANKPSMREYCQEIINTTVDINRAAFKLAHSEIDGFADYLIKERCQGCKCCDPKAEENKNVFCCEQGFAHWVMEMAEKYKGEKHESSNSKRNEHEVCSSDQIDYIKD